LTALDQATTHIERNVFAGPQMPARVLEMPTFTDNGGVADTATQIGIGPTWYDSDGYTPSQYALQDIATVSPFTIGADGLHAVLTSGSMPATVAVGQFCKTTTHPEVHRVLDIGPLFRVVAATEDWDGADQVGSLTRDLTWVGTGWSIVNGNARPSNGGGIVRCDTAIGADVEVEAVITEFPGSVAVMTRKDATATQTYWQFGASFDPLTSPQRYYRLVGITNGAFPAPGVNRVNLFNIVPKVGDRIALRSVGNNHKAYVNGRLVAELPAATAATTGTFGGVTGALGAGELASLGSWTARTTSGATGLVWDGLPHAEAGATSKSLVFTFKGTARDGRDPGADLVTLAAMTQGVRNPARAEFA
jgi:hypothetical protein